ncbi:rap guanine nucleotide exchange factor 4-like isoform X3 [Artemia franciscana]|uniref:rap guanine nucleotide exchange factor 4-like isoform X3 n=1 Tax=Artemia franciscana TaxID=6661 RepID=UPI0032D9BC9C
MFRPRDRSSKECEVLFDSLRKWKSLDRFSVGFLRRLSAFAYLEELGDGVTLYRKGDRGTSWYLILSGEIAAIPYRDQNEANATSVSILDRGSTFGESVLDDAPRKMTAVTRGPCLLLRVEKKDFIQLWERNKNDLTGTANGQVHPNVAHFQQHSKSVDSMTPVSSPVHNFSRSVSSKHLILQNLQNSERRGSASSSRTPSRSNSTESSSTQSTVLPEVTNDQAFASSILHMLLLESGNSIVRDRNVQGRIVKRTLIGSDLVDWLLSISSAFQNRSHACSLLQVLLEEGVLENITSDAVQFQDRGVLYKFTQDSYLDDFSDEVPLPSREEIREAETRKDDAISILLKKAPDAVLRAILRKHPEERTEEDVEAIYEELVHISSLSHLSTSIKRELASVIAFESHPKPGTILFQQGDEGTSWYVILKGSVNVVIHGKGVVNMLKEGEDFGQLALVNNAPRAATIVTREQGCHFLRVDKDDFNRILRDVEANTVRLQEHGKDVLVLEKVPPSSGKPSMYKYTVMAGVPSKMLEHLLETRLDSRNLETREEIIPGKSSIGSTLTTDYFLDDYLLTYILFMPTPQLISELEKNYRIDSSSQDREFVIANKSRVVQFVNQWVATIRDPVFDEKCTHEFFENLLVWLKEDSEALLALEEELEMIEHIVALLNDFRAQQSPNKRKLGQTWTLPSGGQSVTLFSKHEGEEDRQRAIRSTDDIIFRVYCSDHTYCTLRLPISTSAEAIKNSASDKLGLKHSDLVLGEVRSTGEKIIIPNSDIAIPTGLSINGRLFISPREHIDAMTPLPDQEGPSDGTGSELEMFSTRELAYFITLADWEHFNAVHEYELLHHVCRDVKPKRIKSNLDIFLRRFNELQFWIVTEICLAGTLGRRVTLLRKFIKLAAYCKEYQNLNAFFAIVMGLTNVAVSRLTQSWERVPSKLRKLLAEFESLCDPSRNHRSYRIAVSKLQSPIIPFMPLLIKDMTFTNDGNSTVQEASGLINFEKMHLLAQTLRTLRFCRGRQLLIQPPTPRSEMEVQNYLRNLRVIDNQRILTGLSQRLEPKRQ